MALVTDHLCQLRTDWLEVEVTYDDVTLLISSIKATVNPPPGVRVSVQIYRKNQPNNAWKELSWETPGTFELTPPFQGGVKVMDDLPRYSFRWERL